MNDPPQRSGVPGSPPGTLEFIFDRIKDAPLQQIEQVRALDAKMVQVFTGASVLLGLSIFSGHDGGRWVTALLIAALVAYICTAGKSLLELRPVQLRFAGYGATLWSEHYDEDVTAIKVAIVTDITGGSQENQKVIDCKANLLYAALIATSLQATLIAVSLVVSRVT
jgi:hypothetical protein